MYSDVQMNKGGTTEDLAFVLYSSDGSFFLREGTSQAKVPALSFDDAREPGERCFEISPGMREGTSQAKVCPTIIMNISGGHCNE